MYDDLIAFLLGKKAALTEAELDEFIDLLNQVLDTTEEYQILEHQSVVDKMVNKSKVLVLDEVDKEALSAVIDNIMMVQQSESDEEHILDDKEDVAPLRSRKLTRGNFKKSQQTETNTALAAKASNNKEKNIFESLNLKEPQVLDQEDLLKTINSSFIKEMDEKSKNTEIKDQNKEIIHKIANDKLPFNPSNETNKFKFNDKVADASNNVFQELPLRPMSELFSKNASSEVEVEETPFKFNIGELSENHNDGPEFEFNLEISD